MAGLAQGSRTQAPTLGCQTNRQPSSYGHPQASPAQTNRKPFQTRRPLRASAREAQRRQPAGFSLLRPPSVGMTWKGFKPTKTNLGSKQEAEGWGVGLESEGLRRYRGKDRAQPGASALPRATGRPCPEGPLPTPGPGPAGNRPRPIPHRRRGPERRESAGEVYHSGEARQR